MEAYSRTSHYGSMSDPYSGSRTQGSRRGPALIIEDSEEEVQREAYKVNWKIAIPLLILGVFPGLIYLAGVAIANCMGGKEVRVQRPQHDPMGPSPYGADTRPYQQYRRVVEPPRDPSPFEADGRRHQRTRAPEREVRDPAHRPGKVRKDRSGTHRSRREEPSPSAVDRVETHRPPVSAVPKHPERQPKRSTAVPVREGGRLTARETTPLRPATQVVDSSVPAPIREGREPRGRDEEMEVKIYMGTNVIMGSRVDDKPERIAAMKKLAKTLPYSKNAEPGSFQGFLKHMYGGSYQALYS
ncbi:MAG: hypothetical protein KDK96_02705 [Chlamydiia bacterium]|nr:hypothetical protein [Chlamydiia bacterium]